MTIPVQNIYYLLCYAWNKLEIGHVVGTGIDNYSNIESLLAKVLHESTNLLIKRGLNQDYVELEEEVAGIKGRIDFNRSLHKHLFKQGRAICRHDEFTSNILANRILKSTLYRLMRLDTLDKEQRKKLHYLRLRLQHIQDIELQANHFKNIKIHGQNALYGFLMNVCELIFHCTAIQEKGEKSRFNDFLRDEKKMAQLFEAFLRNFLRREQTRFNVGADKIEWQFAADSTGDKDYFPLMNTDITLTNGTEKQVIEVKYYTEALISNFGKERFRSNHLYQLFAYLTNLSLDDSHPGNRNCSGILLYPTVDVHLDETYQLANHRLRIYTLNLNQPWQHIHRDLMGLLEH